MALQGNAWLCVPRLVMAGGVSYVALRFGAVCRA